MTAQVALSKEFLAAYSKLPKKQQRSVRHFTDKFQDDPTSPGINFERINASVDDKVRSVRIDQAYRAIVVHPPKGDVYLLVWVDKHDDAYDWARNRRFEVNPRSGVFQVYNLQQGLAGREVAEAAAEEFAYDAPQTLFSHCDDEQLLLAGVPEPLLTAVRNLYTDDELDAFADYLPEDAAEVLYLIAAGYSWDEAIEETESSRPREEEVVDTEDFGTALSRPESQRQFKIVEGDEELEAMLQAPLEQWRVFLHQSQRRLVRMNANGPARVLGGAGTGKTVVLMHRAKHLLENVFSGTDDRILVTTFTKNLAIDLEANLRNLCPEHFERLDVIHLHGWAMRFLKRQGHGFAMVNTKTKNRLMTQAVIEFDELGKDENFYTEEWNQVILPQEIVDQDSYFKARRVGRGTRLTRIQRAKAWRVFSRYRESLQERGLTEWQELVREARMHIENQGVHLSYKAVLSDEVQDFSEVELKLLRTLAPGGANSLYFVGDGHQRIYGRPTTLGSCGIEIRGRARRLKLNYRTTEQIGSRAVSLLHGLEIDDLDGGLDSMKGYKSLRVGPEPRIEIFARELQERIFIIEQIEQWLEQGVAPESICLATRTNNDIDTRYLPMLTRNNIRAHKIEQYSNQDSRDQGVRVSTMHRLKGLEFSRVLLAGVQRGTIPIEFESHADQVSKENHELRERCLLYVACTRARDELLVVGFGEPSPFFRTE